MRLCACVGVEVEDWPRWRRSTVTTHWRVGEGFDQCSMHSHRLSCAHPAGETLYRFADATPPALVWYPAQRWQAGDEVTITTLPLTLPRDFGVVVERTPGLAAPTEIVAATADGSSVGWRAFRRGYGDTLHALPDELFGASDWASWFVDEMDETSTGADAVLRMPSGEEVTVAARLAELAVLAGRCGGRMAGMGRARRLAGRCRGRSRICAWTATTWARMTGRRAIS